MTDLERNEFIMANYGLIQKCVSECHLAGAEKEDMLQDAVMHVLKIFHRYDSEKGSFSTFIWPEIKQFVYRHNCGMADRTFKMACKISKIKDDFEKINGKEPSNQELAEALGMNISELQTQLSKIDQYNLVYLDSKTEDGESDLYNVDFGKSAYNPEEDFFKNNVKEGVSDSYKILSQKEKQILELRYNLSCKNEKEFSLRKTAETLGTSHESVRVTEKRALSKMREYLEQKELAA